MSMEGIAYVDGGYMPANQATVSIFDHGFLYGDGVFESMVAAEDTIFKLDAHLDRFYRSAATLRINVPLTKDEVAEAVRETVRRNALPLSYIRLLISRGPGFPSLDPRSSEHPTVVIIVHSRALPEQAPEFNGQETKIPTIAVIMAATRRVPSESLDARVKSCNYLNHIMARYEAIEANVNDAILLDTNGYIAEATASNVFVVQHNVIATPSIGNILAGITRATVIEVARGLKYTVVERNLTPYDVFTADEVFLTSTFGGVIPVSKVAGRVIACGEAGPVTLQLRGSLQTLRDNKFTPALTLAR